MLRERFPGRAVLIGGREVDGRGDVAADRFQLPAGMYEQRF